MDNNYIQETLIKKFPELQFGEEDGQFLNILIPRDNYMPVMLELKEMGFDYLFSMTGMDWGKELGVTNHLERTKDRFMIVTKVMIEDRENPEIPSLEKVWKTAHLHEREIYDLFGIVFTGHTVMKRLLLSEDWEGYPMRKDWMDETKMIIR